MTAWMHYWKYVGALWLAFLTTAALLLSCEPIAHADETSYLAALTAAGVPMTWPMMTRPLGPGYQICRDIRDGMAPETSAQQFGWMLRPWGPQIVAAAQHELCPDTLR